jgi:hypothetical protein
MSYQISLNEMFQDTKRHQEIKKLTINFFGKLGLGLDDKLTWLDTNEKPIDYEWWTYSEDYYLRIKNIYLSFNGHLQGEMSIYYKDQEKYRCDIVIYGPRQSFYADETTAGVWIDDSVTKS